MLACFKIDVRFLPSSLYRIYLSGTFSDLTYLNQCYHYNSCFYRFYIRQYLYLLHFKGEIVTFIDYSRDQKVSHLCQTPFQPDYSDH